jgi:hypothetical protein
MVDIMELTPGLRRRRERAEHQKNLILEQLVNGVNGKGDADLDSPNINPSSAEYRLSNSLEQQNNLKNSVENNGTTNAARPWMLPIYTKSNGLTSSSASISKECENGDVSESELALKRENTVKDLTQKLASQNLLSSPAEENKSFNITGELSGWLF